MSYANVEEQSSQPKHHSDDRPKRILLVDDEPNVLASLSKVIGDVYSDYQVKTAETAEQALAVFEESTVDLLITDLKLPEMDGLSLARSTHDRFPETRSILMTAYGTDQVHCDAYRYGCVAYLEKPFDIDHLLRSIDETLVPTAPESDSEPGLAEAVQNYALQQKDVTLRVAQGSSAGILFMSRGVIHFAEFDGLTGHAALVAMLACRQPLIHTSAGSPDVCQENFSVPWQSLAEAARCTSVAEQFRIVRQGQARVFEDVLDGKIVHKSAEDSSFDDILARFRKRASEVESRPEDLLRPTRSQTPFKSNVSLEFRQRQKRLRKLVNSGVEHFRRQEFYKARRCWLAALRLDANCQQAKRNIAVVKKILNKHELN